MLKTNNSVKETEARAVDALRSVLGQVPAIKLKSITRESRIDHAELDIVAKLSVAGRGHTLACEVKENGQPRYVRAGLLQLRSYVAGLGRDVTPVLIAPFLSSAAQELCREQGVGFLDLEGNVRLAFDAVFIERAVASKPAVERRELKSLFKPKSAQVLTVMLRDPARTWRVTELAEAADVSLGHVSNVRSGLLDHEWGQASPQGLFLADPDRLLDAWRDAYEPPAGQRLGFYTTLHGGAFEEAARRVLRAGSDKGRAIFASFSAAHWLAPFARTGTQFFYADEHGLERLQTALALSSPAKGENVSVIVPEDDGVFRDAVEPAPGAVCSGLVRTYLDLSAAGERGQEAAEHLRRERMRWKK
ncbi:MAG TPA: type IV toxin-antitoxin system AbiEi family antitoxin [Steroidobacteraceae bacterium]|nr:type IV toxin-antitoxin system AbiEi family antitoxin [Steroidobacteraceae bacterium]